MNNGIYELSDDGKTLLDVTDKNISEAVIPDGVTHIEENAFDYCHELKNIKVAEGNQYFASFDGVLFSKDLTQIIRYPKAKNGKQYTIPDSVTHICKSAFYECSVLQSIEVAEGNQYFASIDGVLFNKDLTQIIHYSKAKNGNQYIIPDSVTHIGNEAFYNRFKLQSIYIPNSVTHIGEKAFLSCSSLQSIEVAEGNQYFASIDGVLFNKDLTQIICYPEVKNGSKYIIPDSVTHIGDGAFYRCDALQSIDIPNSVTHIGNDAFYGCGAQSIDIPNSVTHIGNEAFNGCLALQSIDIPNSVTYIGDGAFCECGAQSIDIPNSVTHIGNEAFLWCSALQSIDIPDSVTYIGDGAFCGCSALQSIEVAEGNQYFASIDGVLFNKDLTQIICYPEAKNGNQYTIPDSVTHIGNYLFNDCSALQSIEISNSVTHIGNYAFSGCSALQSIDIPNSVTYIGNRVFDLCKSLQSIEVEKDNQYFASIDGVLFNKDLTQIIRYSRAKYGSQYTIPNSVTHIGYEAFSGCEALQNIDIPNSVTHIGDKAFGWCEALRSINIPNSVTHIGDRAFKECRALQSIDIPNSVTHIGDSAFYRCEALQSIDIPNSVTHIGDSVFYRCEALQSIVIPDSVTHIGDYAFSGCEALQSIHIRITDIDSCCVKESAFYDIDVDNCILYIPSGTRWAYRHHPVFRNFKNIEIERIK